MKYKLEKENALSDYSIVRSAFPVFNLNKGIDNCNVGFTQGFLDGNIPFAAEVWRYEEEETLVVYIPDLGLINREDYIEEGIEDVLEDTDETEYYDLSVLNRYMTCKYVEGIFEVNEFYKEFMEHADILEFESNVQNGYVTYYEDANGLEIVSFSVLLKQGASVYAKCLLPLTSFTKTEVFVECCVYILQDDQCIMDLGAGMDAVIRFAKLADNGIEGKIKTEKGFNCNRRVRLRGKALIDFIKKEYPYRYMWAYENIEKSNIYTIVSEDCS